MSDTAAPLPQADETKRPPRWRQAMWLALRLAFVALIFWLVWRWSDIDVDQLRGEASQIRWTWVLPALLIWIVAIWVASARWRILLDVVRRGTSVNALFAFNMIGIFYAQFLPGLISGDMVKGYYLSRDGDEKVKVLSSALMDRFVGIGINGLLGLAALAVSPLVMNTFDLPGFVPPLVFGGVIVALVVAYGMVRFLERFEDRFPGPIKTAFEPIKLYAAHPVALAGASAMSIAYFAVWTLSLWALGAAVGIADLGFFTMLLVLAVVNVAQFLPLSINGAGIREGAVVALLSAYGVGEEKALVFSLLIPLTALGLAAIGGMFMLTDYRPGSPQTDSD
ncbi:MAG: lysylphosphatidylglycerol synthase transmembrane domain-containing protein [Chloroflexota bacterium]